MKLFLTKLMASIKFFILADAILNYFQHIKCSSALIVHSTTDFPIFTCRLSATAYKRIAIRILWLPRNTKWPKMKNTVTEEWQGKQMSSKRKQQNHKEICARDHNYVLQNISLKNIGTHRARSRTYICRSHRGV